LYVSCCTTAAMMGVLKQTFTRQLLACGAQNPQVMIQAV